MDGFLIRLAQRAAGMPTSLPVWPSGPAAQPVVDSLVPSAPLSDRDIPIEALSVPPVTGITGSATAPRHSLDAPRPNTGGVSPAPKPSAPDQPLAGDHRPRTANTDGARGRSPPVVIAGEVPQRLDGLEVPPLTNLPFSVPTEPKAPSGTIGDNGPHPRGAPHTKPERVGKTRHVTPRKSSPSIAESRTVSHRFSGNSVTVEGADSIAPIQTAAGARETRSLARPTPLLPRATAMPPAANREPIRAQAEEEGTVVEVHIGRIEVKVEPPPAQPAPAPRITGFDAYRGIRTYVDRNWY